MDDPASQSPRQGKNAAIVRAHRMEFGAEIQSNGAVRFRLWAPGCRSVSLALRDGPVLPMRPAGHGWFELATAEARVGTSYQFVLPDGLHVPDPASRFQPEDAHGPSEVIDPTEYAWRDANWRGRPWHEAVLYELHIGTFTPEGTFRAAIGRLDHLATLGVTAVEIMPVADFPGRRNWGYDGVQPFAPDSSYGRPEDLKALVDAAHARGIMVLLDVVYNHFGPDGNYLPVYAPPIFTDRHKTPWGSAVNYDSKGSPAVREFVIQNALYWMREYNLDGLRLDAVHAIVDDSPRHVLNELAERVRQHVAGRYVHLVLENERNEAHLLARDESGAPRYYTAQWNDDVHHVLHVAATGEDQGYYAEYAGKTDLLGRALAEGFAFQGQMMVYRGGPRGEPSADLPPITFIGFIQNHDQVGNRAFGERIGALASPEAVRAIAAVYLLLPQIPMLFMGEEWGAAQPFPFFCDFSGELADAVRDGRRQEFARFPQFHDPESRARIPDPQAEATFASAKLDWSALTREPHAGTLAWYQRILSVRRQRLVPLLRGAAAGGLYRAWGTGQAVATWQLDESAELTLAANLSAARQGGFPPGAGDVLWREGQVGDDGWFGPWAVRWSLRTRT